jgi:hypothetical protein
VLESKGSPQLADVAGARLVDWPPADWTQREPTNERKLAAGHRAQIFNFLSYGVIDLTAAVWRAVSRAGVERVDAASRRRWREIGGLPTSGLVATRAHE